MAAARATSMAAAHSPKPRRAHGTRSRHCLSPLAAPSSAMAHSSLYRTVWWRRAAVYACSIASTQCHRSGGISLSHAVGLVTARQRAHAGLPVELHNRLALHANPHLNHLTYVLDSFGCFAGAPCARARYVLPGIFYAPDRAGTELRAGGLDKGSLEAELSEGEMTRDGGEMARDGGEVARGGGERGLLGLEASSQLQNANFGSCSRPPSVAHPLHPPHPTPPLAPPTPPPPPPPPLLPPSLTKQTLPKSSTSGLMRWWRRRTLGAVVSKGEEVMAAASVTTAESPMCAVASVTVGLVVQEPEMRAEEVQDGEEGKLATAGPGASVCLHLEVASHSGTDVLK